MTAIDSAQQLAKLLTVLGRPDPNLSEVARRWEAERYLMRTNPKLASLFRAEAIADGRAECHVSEAAKLPVIRDLLVAIIEAETGKPFKNPLFP